LHSLRRLPINQVNPCVFSLTAQYQGIEEMFDQNTNNKPPEFIKAAMKLKNAVAYESTGKYESALISLEEALVIQPNYIDAWIIKGAI